jgi:hypothetical protein
MSCEAARGLGCTNISVTLSDRSDSVYQPTGEVSPKKTSFLDNLLGKSSSKVEKSSSGSSWTTSLFSKKSASTSVPEQQVDSRTAALIEELRNEGRTQGDIDMHLSFIHDMPKTPTPTPPPVKSSKNVFTQFFREIQQAFKEEVYEPYPIYEDDVQRLTIHISTGPFMAALPPNSDLSYEELATFEPLFMGTSSCVNNLPSCKHDGTPLPGDQSHCPICLGEFTEGEQLKSLPCVHFYHKDCIDSWLMVGHACPVCKTLVV